MIKNIKTFFKKKSFLMILVPFLLLMVLAFYNALYSLFTEFGTSVGQKRLLLVFIFSCGYIFQFFSLVAISKSIKQKDFKSSFLTALFTGALLFIIPARNEIHYDVFLHSIAALLGMGFVLSSGLKENFSPRINEQTVFVWTLVLGYLFFINKVSVILWSVFLPLAIFSIINIYTNLDRYNFVRVILYIFFLATIIGVYLIHFHFSEIGFFFQNKINYNWTLLSVFTSGMLIGYITPYCTYLLSLWPLPDSGQKWESRKKELKQVLKDFNRYFDPHKNFPLKNTCLGLSIIVFLFLNYKFHLIAETYLITLTFIFIRVGNTIHERYFLPKISISK